MVYLHRSKEHSHGRELLFLMLAAFHIYSYVPYKEWAMELGVVGNDYFQAPRNHYDRFVHFSFGFLLFPYIVFLCRKWLNRNNAVAVFMAWMIVQTGSMIYELFEWLLTVFMSSDDAESYNGQQGDMWDAQKDMALALVGSTIMMVFYLLKRLFRAK